MLIRVNITESNDNLSKSSSRRKGQWKIWNGLFSIVAFYSEISFKGAWLEEATYSPRRSTCEIIFC